jgi:hypothetical protein
LFGLRQGRGGAIFAHTPQSDIKLTLFSATVKRVPIDRAELDRLQRAYKAAVDEWVGAIREEEALATPDYSLPAWECWDQAGFKENVAQDKAKAEGSLQRSAPAT